MIPEQVVVAGIGTANIECTYVLLPSRLVGSDLVHLALCPYVRLKSNIGERAGW